jgi:hypothetical protein
MATTVSWNTTGFGTIYVPRADMPIVQVSPEQRSIDVNELRGDVGALYASVAGGLYARPFRHEGESTLSGITHARKVRFLYAIEFEDGQYTVIPSGANHNIGDVAVENQVRLVINNSLGLIGGAALTRGGIG